MKNTILVLFAVTALLFFADGNLHAQENSSRTIIIRVVEGHGVKPGFVTIDSDGKTTETTLERGHDIETSAKNGVLIFNKNSTNGSVRGIKLLM